MTTESLKVVGTGPVLVDQFVHVHDLPIADDLPQPGSKLQAFDGEHMARVRKQWVEGWQVQTQVGGPVLVALRQSRLLGADVDFVGAVGSDENGDIIVNTFEEIGFDASRLVRQEGRRSGSAIVWIDRNGERSILFDSGSLEPLPEKAALGLLNDGPSVVHIDSREPHAAITLATKAGERGVRVHYDVDPWNDWSDSLLAKTSIAQCSERELLQHFPNEKPLDVARRLQSEKKLELMIITRGERGVSCVTDSEVIEIPACRSYSVDSTGAGDAFSGAFEHASLSGADTQGALLAGCAAGAFMSSHLGNLELATAEDIKALIG